MSSIDLPARSGPHLGSMSTPRGAWKGKHLPWVIAHQIIASALIVGWARLLWWAGRHCGSF
ncbi:hypothetical protein ACVIGB_001114 [Bradyrhizobium sp. USDA 4341]